MFDVIYLTLFCYNFVDKLNDVICRFTKKKYFNILVLMFYKHNNTLSTSYNTDRNKQFKSLLLCKYKATLNNNKYMLMKYFLQYKHKCSYAKVMLLNYSTMFKWIERVIISTI